MLSRILTLALSCFVSLAIVAFFASRSGTLALENFAGATADRDQDLVPIATGDSTFPNARPASLEATTGYAARTAKPIDVSERQFHRLASRGLVLVKFGADWCGPCRRVVAELEQLASDNVGLTVLAVDVDKEQNLAKRFNVGAIPRMILFRDGKQLDSWTGFERASKMQAVVDAAKARGAKGKIQANPFR